MPSHEARVRVWSALSDIFLDVENDASYYEYAARTILQSGFTREEALSILWHEIYPAMSGNLLPLLGAWQPWPDEWLKENVKPAPVRKPPAFRLHRKHVQAEWARIAASFPESYT